MRTAILASLLLVACGSDDPPAGTDASVTPPIDAAVTIDGPVDAPASLALTSPVLTEGAAIDPAYTCNGANQSPQLDWAGSVGGTLSYAVVLTDKTNGLVHSVIYDIPASATGLPAAVEKVYAPANVPGAHQTRSYQMAVRGYNGPCPGSLHTYELKLYALDAAVLPTATMATTKEQAVALFEMHDLASATLTGTYAP